MLHFFLDIISLYLVIRTHFRSYTILKLNNSIKAFSGWDIALIVPDSIPGKYLSYGAFWGRGNSIHANNPFRILIVLVCFKHRLIALLLLTGCDYFLQPMFSEWLVPTRIVFVYNKCQKSNSTVILQQADWFLAMLFVSRPCAHQFYNWLQETGIYYNQN